MCSTEQKAASNSFCQLITPPPHIRLPVCVGAWFYSDWGPTEKVEHMTLFFWDRVQQQEEVFIMTLMYIAANTPRCFQEETCACAMVVFVVYESCEDGTFSYQMTAAPWQQKVTQGHYKHSETTCDLNDARHIY